MKSAIISDIHSNLEALDAVLEHIDKRNIKNIFCLGDIIGYGASPKEVLDIILERNIPSVRGNHEQGFTNYSNFNELAKDAIDWTGSQLTENEIKYLSELPLSLSFDEIRLVHGCPPDSNIHYIYQVSNIKQIMDSISENYVFVGHTHTPKMYTPNNAYAPVNLQNTFLKPKTLINIGSVGQPRNGDSRAQYVTFSDKSKKLIEHKVAYDIEKSAYKIINAGLSEISAARLSYAR